ncbi:MAG: hypothetical protein MUP47_07625 [Phycisphaerae bacterium]|nr:hypothetical protein [Phycisphaerae bacterium]
MDDSHLDPRKGLALQHASERNRMEKLLLGQAYERLLPVVCRSLNCGSPAWRSTGWPSGESLVPGRAAEGA